jgi:hypothetical protein
MRNSKTIFVRNDHPSGHYEGRRKSEDISRYLAPTFRVAALPHFTSPTLLGIRGRPGNILLYGPPGTGKTLLAQVASQVALHYHPLFSHIRATVIHLPTPLQAAAHEAGAKLFNVHPSDVLSKYHGESEKFISNIFRVARQLEIPSIIFFDGKHFSANSNALTHRLVFCELTRLIDFCIPTYSVVVLMGADHIEIDSIATTRDHADASLQSKRILSELLIQMSLQRQIDEAGCTEQTRLQSQCIISQILSLCFLWYQ